MRFPFGNSAVPTLTYAHEPMVGGCLVQTAGGEITLLHSDTAGVMLRKRVKTGYNTAMTGQCAGQGSATPRTGPEECETCR